MKKRGLSINDAKDRKYGDDAAEEWSIPVSWEEDPVIKAHDQKLMCKGPNKR